MDRPHPLPTASRLGAPFPPRGSRGLVPPLRRYYEALRFPADRFAALGLCFAWRYHPVRLCSSLPPGPTPTGGPGTLWYGSPHAMLCRGGAAGRPSSWGILVCLCHVLRSRRDRTHQAFAVCRRGPRSDKAEGSPRVGLSRLNSTAWALAVYASQGGLPHRHARLASGCWPGSTGWDWLPTGLLRKVSAMHSLHPSPFPKLAWRNVRNCRRNEVQLRYAFLIKCEHTSSRMTRPARWSRCIARSTRTRAAAARRPTAR